MPDTTSHLAIALGTISGAIAFAFDVPAPVVCAAFAGSCFAVGASGKFTYLGALFMVIGGTVASSYLTPLAHQIIGDYALRPIAAIIAFAIVHFKDGVITGLQDIGNAVKARAIQLIGGSK